MPAVPESVRFQGRALRCESPILAGGCPTYFSCAKKNEGFLTSKATLTAPDLVIERVSPNDRRSDISTTETDYRAIGVGEIVYMDQQKQTVRVLRRTADDYEEEKPTEEPLVLRSLDNVALEWDWIFFEPRPDGINTVLALLQNASLTVVS